MKSRDRKRRRWSVKDMFTKKKIISAFVLVIFLGTTVLAFAPSLFYRVFLNMQSISDIPMVNIDTGYKGAFRKFASRKMLIIIFDNTKSDDYKKVLALISDLREYIESKGFRIIFILSDGDRASLVKYLSEEKPYLFNVLTWLHDENGIMKDKLGANLSKARIYYMSNVDWSYKYIGDSSINKATLIFKLSNLG